MGISAVIITKNEEKNIGRCLESLEGVADEIIVVDTFSTDKTQEICRAYGARVVEKEWEGYSATKNFANDLATQAYVLSLDADEALSPELKASLLAVKPALKDAYSFNRLAYYCGKPIRHAGWYPDRKVRLFPKGKAHWEGEFVHEDLITELPITQLAGDLLHYTYYTVQEHVERADRYSTLAAQKIAASAKGGLLARAYGSAAWRFLRMYLLKGGILDGKLGFQLCRITAGEVYQKYSKARNLRQEK